MSTSEPATRAAMPNESKSQRALAAARQVRHFSENAKNRQFAGTRAPEAEKGKSAAKAAALFDVGTRAVEQALSVLGRGVPALVQAIQCRHIGDRMA
jgi:hypothetical protein